jgi:Ca2+-binding EF-hand superfamily protein
VKRDIANCKLHIAICNLFFLFVVSGTLAQDKTKPRIDPSSAADVQDLVFYGKSRPLLIRLHLLVDGKPHSAGWDAHVQRRFDRADRNKDGYLDREEARTIPSVQAVQQMARGATVFYNTPAAGFADLDRDGDGKVSPAELRAYFHTAQTDPVRLAASGQAGTGTRLTEALFRELDRNKDGKLSKEELAGAERLVKRLDADEDETLASGELLTQPLARGLGQPVVIGGSGGMMRPGRQAQGAGSFFLVPREKKANRLTERLRLGKELIAHYDRDKSGKLTRKEIGLPKDLFNRLDRNQDGILDVVELMHYVIVAPDLEVTLRLGKQEAKAAVEVTPGSKANLARDTRSSPDSVTLALSGTRFAVRRAESIRFANSNPAQYAMQLFRVVDPANKGEVEVKKVGQTAYRYMQSLFEMADANGDGKVTTQELTDALALNAEVSTCTMTLSVSEVGQGMFEMLDVSGDGRLSIRELRRAWERLKEFDKDGDGAISDQELPYQYELAVASGPYVYRRPSPGQARAVSAPTAGPVWFRKMDRNGDGDISPREFLGTPAQFKALDTDNDGFISLEEAEKADTRLRKGSKP